LSKGFKSDKPPKLDNKLFPELPASSTTKERLQVSGNRSLRRIMKNTGPTVSAWQPGNGDGGAETGVEGEVEESTGGKKGKKGKGKQKQMLFTLGSFPT